MVGFQVLILTAILGTLLGFAVYSTSSLIIGSATYVSCWIAIHRRFTRKARFELFPWIASSILAAFLGSTICTIVGFNFGSSPLPMRPSTASETAAIIVGSIMVTGMLWIVGIPDFVAHVRRVEALDPDQSELR